MHSGWIYWIAGTGTLVLLSSCALEPLDAPPTSTITQGGGGKGTGGFGGSAPEESPYLELPITSQKLFASDAEDGRYFGESVALSGDTAVVGSRSSDGMYFFSQSEGEWTEVLRVDLPESGVNSLALDGDLAVAGVSGQPSPGRVYVLRRNDDQWDIEATLEDISGDGQALFGSAVAVSDETIVVGARRNHDGASGAAHVFVKDALGWKEQGKLMATDAISDDQFGFSVAISGDWIAVARPHGEARQALLFRRENGVWTEEPSFPSDPSLLGQAISVSLDGERLLVGDNQYEKGHTFLIADTAMWEAETSLTASPADNLAYSVALAGDMAVLGGLVPNNEGLDGHGNAYAFVRSEKGWSKPIALVPEGGPTGAGFGWPVAASGSTVVVGAAWDDEQGEEAGAVYVFNLDLTKVY